MKYINPHIEIFDKIDSTNVYLLQKAKEKELEEGYIIMTLNQTHGKGQRGNLWFSEANKNLLFSIFLRPIIPTKKNFYLNIISSLAVQKTLKDLKINAKIKWPNDILVDKKKISGILIENSIQNNQIHQTVIGIGLNVNQQKFNDEIFASSIINEIGLELDLKDVLMQFVAYLDFYYDFLKQSNYDFLLKKYYENLYAFHEIKKFQTNSMQFEGEIIGITDEGKLKIKPKSGLIQIYDLKEIKFLL